jgi:hypothetical protein
VSQAQVPGRFRIGPADGHPHGSPGPGGLSPLLLPAIASAACLMNVLRRIGPRVYDPLVRSRAPLPPLVYPTPLPLYSSWPIRRRSLKRWNVHEQSQFFWVDDAFGVTQYESPLVYGWNRSLAQVKAMVRQGAKIVMTSPDWRLYQGHAHCRTAPDDRRKASTSCDPPCGGRRSEKGRKPPSRRPSRSHLRRSNMRRIIVGSAAVVTVLMISGCSNLPFGGGSRSSDRIDRMERSTPRSTTGDYRTSPGSTGGGIMGPGPAGTTPGSGTHSDLPGTTRDRRN